MVLQVALNSDVQPSPLEPGSSRFYQWTLIAFNNIGGPSKLTELNGNWPIRLQGLLNRRALSLKRIIWF
jgi:hypothetical protein